jgi:hypothetical protein
VVIRKRIMVLIVLAAFSAGCRSPQPQQPIFQQQGKFNVIAGQEGIVYFPQSYAQQPNVELDGADPDVNKTYISEVTAASFKWKNTGENNFFNNAVVGWTAKGVK